ncbi:MAG: LamG domain-containing protein [Desulfuromonas thiophila]|nr:LamG domain-containing protein [Desulfuromonas thiophila]
MLLSNRMLLLWLLVGLTVLLPGCKTVMEYHLDECNRSEVLADSSATANHATRLHAAGNSDGLYAAYVFDPASYVVCAGRRFRGEGYNADPNNAWYGARYYLEAPDHPDISPLSNVSLFSDGKMTLTGWFKTSGNGTLLCKAGDSSDSREYRVFVEGGALKVSIWNRYGGASTFTVAAGVANGQWHAFAITARNSFSGTLQVSMYFDGAATGTSSVTNYAGYCEKTTGPLVIGAMNWGNGNITNFFDGVIDEIAMTDDVESSADLSKAYNNQRQHKNADGSSRSCPSCVTGPDHFEFIHDGQGLTCASETVTLRACGNADCSQRFSGTVQVTLPDLGWLNGRIQTLVFPASGEVQLKLKHTTAETVQLGLVNSAPEVVGATRCFIGATQSCALFFADAGFVLEFDSLTGNGPPSGRSCTAVAGLLRAVRKNDDASVCVGDDSFADVTRNVRFWSGYAEPATGTRSLALNGQTLSTASPGTALALSFNAQAAAPLSLRYADAGSVHLYARYDGQEASQDAGLLMTGSTAAPVVFAPDHFVVTSPLDNATAAGDPKLAAGLPFEVTVTAVCGDGTVTPNFAWPTQLSVADVQPSGGRAGVLAPTSLTAADFTAGRATPDLTYSEVGNVTLQAQATNYLGSGREISGSGQLGRFMPHHFRLTRGSLTNRIDSACASPATFTYLDEPLALTFILEAENAANDRTQNYVGAYAKLSADEDEAAPAGEVYRVTAVDAPGGSATSLGGRLLVDGRQRDSGWAAGSADFSLRLRLARAALPLPPDGPFNDVRFGVVLQDADGVAIAALDLDSDGDGVADSAQAAGAAVLRQGRLRLVNAHGSELLPLALPVLAEYYNGTSFVPHGADSCTALALTDFSFVADPAGLPGANAFTPLAAGAGALNWTSGPGSPGAVAVTAQLAALPWLQFDWNADASYGDPTARATFGIYKGSERIIYLRETTWR